MPPHPVALQPPLIAINAPRARASERIASKDFGENGLERAPPAILNGSTGGRVRGAVAPLLQLDDKCPGFLEIIALDSVCRARFLILRNTMKADNPLQFVFRKPATQNRGVAGRSRHMLIMLTCIATSGVILTPSEEEPLCRLVRNPNAPIPPTSPNILSYYLCQGTCPGSPPAPECRMLQWARGEWRNNSCWCNGVLPPTMCKGSVEMRYVTDLGLAEFNGPWCETKSCVNTCTVNNSGTEVCTCP